METEELVEGIIKEIRRRKIPSWSMPDQIRQIMYKKKNCPSPESPAGHRIFCLVCLGLEISLRGNKFNKKSWRP